MAKDEIKLDVVKFPSPTPIQTGKYLDVRGLSVHGSPTAIQDICLPSGAALITTANGVAPYALQYKCLWLRRDVGGKKVKWKLITHGNVQILIPEVVGAPQEPYVDDPGEEEDDVDEDEEEE